MLRALIKKISRATATVRVPLTAPAAPTQPGVADPFNPYAAHQRNLSAEGWFNHASGELLTGFPVGPDDIVLDVGCGGGAHASFCAARGAHVIFADIDPVKVADTEQRLKGSPARALQAIVTDANPLPLPDGLATRVVSTEVLEHVDDPAAFLRELVRVGQSGAQYLLAVPDPGSEAIMKVLAHPSYFEAPNHIRVLSRDAFRELVSDAGLVIERTLSLGFFQTIWWAMYWCDHQDGLAPRHPALDKWAEAWNALLDSGNGDAVRRALDQALPKNQVILARKP